MGVMLEIARTRYTTKHYDATQPVTDEELNELLEILRLAPSSINIQPWHFYVVRSPEARVKLLPAIMDFNIKRVEEASAIVIIATESGLEERVATITDQERIDGRFDKAARASGFDRAVEAVRANSVKRYCSGEDKGFNWASDQAHIALGFLLFGAAGMGIDATALGGIKFELVDELFGLKAIGRHAVVGCALGHRAKDDSNAKRPKSRLPREAVVTVL